MLFPLDLAWFYLFCKWTPLPADVLEKGCEGELVRRISIVPRPRVEIVEWEEKGVRGRRREGGDLSQQGSAPNALRLQTSLQGCGPQHAYTMNGNDFCFYFFCLKMTRL